MILLVIIYITFAGMGLTDPVLGTAWPVLQPTFGAALELAGVISMFVTGMKVVSGLMTERFTRRFGTGVTVMVSEGLLALSLFGCSCATAMWQIFLWACVQGIGAGVVDTGLNDYVSRSYTARYVSWLHCFWGVGSTIAPLIMGNYLARSNWQGGYRSVAGILAAIVVLLLTTLSLWKKNAEVSIREGAKRCSFRETLRLRGVSSILLTMFCYSAAEVTASLWACSYLVEAGGMDADAAARFASLVFVGVTGGRLLGGFVAERVGDIRLTQIGTVVAMIGTALLFLRSNTATCVGLLLTGIGCGPTFPSMIHAAPTRFGKDHSGAVIAMEMAGANVGCALMPLLFGVLARRVSIRLMPPYLLLFFLLVLFFARQLDRRTRP